MAKPPSRPEQPRSEPGLPQSEAVMRADEAWAPASESLGVPQAPRFAVAQREPPAPWLAVLGLLLAALGLGFGLRTHGVPRLRCGRFGRAGAQLLARGLTGPRTRVYVPHDAQPFLRFRLTGEESHVQT